MFSGELGSVPGEQHICMNTTIKPVIMPAKRIALAVRPKLREELTRLRPPSVIAPVDKPTLWVSQVVLILEKNGVIRMFVDPHELNKALVTGSLSTSSFGRHSAQVEACNSVLQGRFGVWVIACLGEQ